ncbi:MAG: Zn-dependent hydrolase [Symplocastrum torsivum CPER-KK1]|jgi:N-carbamoyl-L-amino-acid hydrolase|uniref:Zn-dependent hydrolase n=1 Tax=Symplocastrum torsivum CPER-KK1 TaxID=450513 RepID=A0A951U7Z6_9CYAN|nr:Zn-dependent hydrolase [Symplocastrum torsivum CPER-KK1]
MEVLPLLSINGDRLNRSLAQLAEIGKLPHGGVSRVAFTTEDLLARQLVQSWMIEAGMTVRTDAAGNIIGKYAGRREGRAALATGSHIDTVPVAGRYDGCLGVLAGIEVVRVLHDNHLRLDHPIEVIVFTDEECTVLGCKAMAGEVVNDPGYYRRNDGTPIQTCLEKIGGDWSKIATAKRDRTEIAAFVELHVEQGGVLETTEAQIGVVKGIVGQYRFAVTVTGRPNHAGTTPMNMRKDALVAASQVVLAVNKLGVETPGEQVATVGYFNVSPNAVNIVPGQVDLKIDLRDLSQEHLEDLIRQMEQEFNAIATATQTEIVMHQVLHVLPTLSAPKIIDTIVQVCEELGLSYCHLPSRAGHDAQEIGRFTDMGMIFVPSRAGISHAEDEYTSPEQCIQGSNMLLQTFLKLDRLYPV